MANERIQLSDSVFDIVRKVGEGNPGATRVIMELMSRGKDIDPDDFMGGIGCVLSLDSLNIYGAEIWMLYKDVCGEDLGKTVGMLRANQLGFLPDYTLKGAINSRGNGLDVDALMTQVRERLPNFNG